MYVIYNRKRNEVYRNIGDRKLLFCSGSCVGEIVEVVDPIMEEVVDMCESCIKNWKELGYNYERR